MTSSTATLAGLSSAVRSHIAPPRLPTTIKAHGQTLASPELYHAEFQFKTHEA